MNWLEHNRRALSETSWTLAPATVGLVWQKLHLPIAVRQPPVLLLL